MSDESQTESENGQHVNGDSVPAVSNGRAVRYSEPPPEAGLIKLPKGIQKLQQLGVNVRAAGLSEIKSGAILVTMEGACDIQRELTKAIKDLAKRPLEDADAFDEEGNPIGPTVGESMAQLANAFASVMKGQAAMLKAAGEISATEKSTKGRKSFAKGTPMGPPIDVKPN